jgi:hypothetical protein
MHGMFISWKKELTYLRKKNIFFSLFDGLCSGSWYREWGFFDMMSNQSFTFFKKFFFDINENICFRSIMNPPKPSKDKESPGASSSSQVTFVS